ncbi:IS5 family transposase [Spartinivicinus poritis]|uniref:IS5 family transposase n=1 Tax=Spartinivicinus poritis TaxID=2994640 RepID=A0ABT5UH31_9GAMM|nr:IS5 family transposase [Spartinivicinus sp. A2-2]MDE1465617.1 IS5 family transposase [Spartinivicinus sp. A2-2]
MDYPTDLTDAQWEKLSPLLPIPKWQPGNRGRPPANRRLVIHALLYVLKTGCQWRMLPKEFGCWQTVYGYFNTWSQQGVWEAIMDSFRRYYREQLGRKADPSAGCIDSQSIKTHTQGIHVGFDGGKKVKGRKRHILVDTLGIIICVVVTSAAVGEREGLKRLLKGYVKKSMTSLLKIWLDSGYSGTPIIEWVKDFHKVTQEIILEVVERAGKGFNVVKQRWVVERTVSWLINYRRHAKDYEVLTQNSEAMVQIAMIYILVRRIA